MNWGGHETAVPAALDEGEAAAQNLEHRPVARIIPTLIVLAGLTGLHCSPTPSDNSSSEASQQPDLPSLDPSGMEPRVAKRIFEARDAVVADPKSAQAWGHFGEVCHAHFLYDKAEVCYRNALALTPDDFRWTYLWALVRDQINADPDQVIEGFQSTAKLDPRYPPARYHLGLALGRAGRLKEAKKAFLKAIELDPDFAVAYRAAGQVLLSIGDVDGAVKHFEKAADLVPEDGAAYTALAQAFTRRGQQDLAGQTLQKAAGLQPIDSIKDPIRDRMSGLAISATACTLRARNLMGRGDFASAISQLKIVLEVAPNDPQAQLDIANAYLNFGKPDLAISHFRRAISLKDDLISAYVRLGWLLMARDQLDESIKQFRGGLVKAPDDFRLHGGLAMALIRRGKFDEAVTVCERAAALAPESADIHTICATALLERGDLEQAVQRFREALKLDPNHREAGRRLAQTIEKLESRGKNPASGPRGEGP